MMSSQVQSSLGCWLKDLLERTHRNVATVALANKLARIASAVLAHERRFIAGHAALPEPRRRSIVIAGSQGFRQVCERMNQTVRSS
jgi:hypothetical protein